MPPRQQVRGLAVVLGVSLAAGCATGRAMTVDVGVTGVADAPCTVEVEGRRIAMPDFPAFARTWRGREAHLRGGINTPYRCIGGVIYELQRAGFRRIGFIAEPPPAGPEPGH